MITELVGKVQRGFSDEQLSQIRRAFREELADAGLRLDDGRSQDAAREDFRFLRRLRLAWDGSTTKVGTAVLTAAIIVLGVIVTSGFWAWIGSAESRRNGRDHVQQFTMSGRTPEKELKAGTAALIGTGEGPSPRAR